MLRRRDRVRRGAAMGQRIGYIALAVAIVAFVIGMLNDLPAWSVGVVLVSMAVATGLLIPSIILGYAVKAAAREDRERGRPT